MSSSRKKPGRPKKEHSQNKMVLRVDLEEELQENFLKIKNEQNLANNTEVLRYCIREMSSNRIYKIPNGLFKFMEDLVKDRRIQERYFVSSVSDFINRALQLFVNKANADRTNLYDLSFRSSLDSKSREVANILIDLQTQNPKWGVKLQELHSNIPNYSKNEIQTILTSFVDRKLIKVMDFKSEDHYFALDRGYLTEEPLGEL